MRTLDVTMLWIHCYSGNVSYRYQEQAPACSSIRRWYEKCQTQRGHSHRSWNSRPQIDDDKMKRTGLIFNEYPAFSLPNAAARTAVHHMTIWHSLRQLFKHFLYKQQMHQQIADSDKLGRISFGQNYQDEIRGDSKFPKRVCFPMSANFHFAELRTKQICRIWRSERLQKCTKHCRTTSLFCFRASWHKTK